MAPDLAAPPVDFQRAYLDARATGDPITVPGTTITCYPPTGSRRHWRLVYRLDGRRETTCRDDVVLLHNRLADLRRRCSRASTPKAYQPVAEMIDAYLRQHEANGSWRGRTPHDRRVDTDNLRHVCAGVACIDLDVTHLRAAVDRCGTRKRGDFVRKRLEAMLNWASNQDWISGDQARLIDKVEWTAPSGWTEPPSRRVMARRAGQPSGGVDRGDVPSARQVADWGCAVREYYVHGQGLIELDAATGLRLGELLPLTADPDVAARGLCNYVDLEAWEIRVRVQIIDRMRSAALPKADKIRDVIVPRTAQVTTGFDLRTWLLGRSAAALAEQAAGTNRLALYFPSPRGLVWSQGNLTKRCLHHAYSDLGWPTTTVVDKNGRCRVHQRWSMHSLRDVYACTAVDGWGFSESQLFEQGGWTDRETVARYYLGITDETHNQVRRLVG